jgi:hypothetical protein
VVSKRDIFECGDFANTELGVQDERSIVGKRDARNELMNPRFRSEPFE